MPFASTPTFCKAIQKLVIYINRKRLLLRETKIDLSKLSSGCFYQFRFTFGRVRFEEFKGNEKHLVLDVRVRHDIKPRHNLS